MYTLVMKKEFPGNNHETINNEVEHYNDDRKISGEEATRIQLQKEKDEYEYENELSKQKIKDQKDIERITEEAVQSAQTEKNEGPEDESKTPSNSATKNKISSFKKFALALGFTMAGVAGQAKSAPENHKDTASIEKITKIENHQEMHGITLEGMISVPMTDTSAEYFFMAFSGDSKDSDKINKLRKAIVELGYELANSEELKLAIEKHGQDLLKATGGYGISLKDVSMKVDDTKNTVINNIQHGPNTHVLTTFNPVGKIGRYELEALEKTDFEYSDYPVFVKKNKETVKTVDYRDHLKIN